jgi:hypothetical protein
MASGFLISWALVQVVYPLHGYPALKTIHAFSITSIFTVVSIVRSYVWRRIFNHYIKKRLKKEGWYIGD